LRVPKFRVFLKFWLPVLVWMTLIFSASGDSHSSEHTSRIFEPFLHWLFPQMSPAHIENIHLVIRKCGHFSEYALLALLIWRAVRQPQKNDPRPWNWQEAGLALSIVFLYAASDEFHQIFVPTRTARVSDVLIDTSGGAIALILIWLVGFYRRHPRQR
jgi:VanZ family protein